MRRLSRGLGSAAGWCSGVAIFLLARLASAQQTTPHLDRLEVPGAPDDGLALFRPVTNQQSIFFGQLALGWSLNPLHTVNITNNPFTLSRSSAAIITDQLTSYATAGFELLDRVTLAVTLPITYVETGNQFEGGSAPATAWSTSGPGVSDTRIDVRGVLFRNADRTAAFGAQGSLFAPSGNGSPDNFIGDNGTAAMLMVTGEYTLALRRFTLTLVGNTGFDFRPQNAVNEPTLQNGNGLGVGDEWRWAVGAFVPIKDGKFRLGATIFGQTGIQSSNVIGSTAFTGRNSPIEWNVEGRMKFGINGGAERWFVGAGAGTRIADGYGAPDFRLVAMIGAWIPILDSDANSPAAKLALRQQIHESLVDTDHDGIPDEVDPCPLVPEDHKPPDPNDGCPAPQDRDKDGIPDDQDACPDTPGVFSTDPKKNGCPPPAGDNDRDHDGIPNAQDACPDVPGKPSPDPTKNGCPQHITVDTGGTVHTLQNIQFVTDSATILPQSFPILQEVVDLLQSRPGITKMRVEGHTDNVGPADYNMQLSQRRAASVRAWLIGKGISPDRLEAQGYGLTRPVNGEDPYKGENNTEPVRTKNRRVEFKILVEDGQTVNQ